MIMQDHKTTNILPEPDSQLEQLVAEALLHDAATEPDADAEWQRLVARVGEKIDGIDRIDDIDKMDDIDKIDGIDNNHLFGRRPRFVAMFAAAAAVAVVVAVFLLHYGKEAVPEGTLYLAKDAPREIRLVTGDDREGRVVTGDVPQATAVSVEQCTLVVPEGKDARVTLADGTRVWVNANSRLSYPSRFEGGERRVSVEGEAYFEVAHDAAHPFIVRAGDVETRVLGTRFNVSTHGEQPQVALAEGSVRVSAGQMSKVIAPGEGATLSTGGQIEVRDVDIDDIIAWTEGIEVFDDATLEEILMQLGAWYNMGVVCHNKEALTDHMRYMYDRNAPVADAVAMLNKISKVKVTIDNNTILVQ